MFEIDKKKFSLLISVITGFALDAITAFASATNVKSGTITSSLAAIPSAFNPTYYAVVPLVTAMAYFVPTKLATKEDFGER